MSSRAERRREQRQAKKDLNKANQLLQAHGLPKLEPVVAPSAFLKKDYTEQEVADLTGTSVEILRQWQSKREEEIRKALIIEAQEKLDTASNYIGMCNVMAALKALDGFRYAKSAANYMLEHYSQAIDQVDQHKVRKIYDDLHERWGIEMEFEDYDLNKAMGFDAVDWTYNYVHMHVPEAVYKTIYNDASNIEKVLIQISVIWALCEGFNFHKHMDKPSNMLRKFMSISKEKYDQLEGMKHAGAYGIKLLKEKYDVDIGWSDKIQKTIDRFNL